MSKNENLKMFILPPAADGMCPECAVKHDSNLPHNQRSIFYQYKFFAEFGRWPTWKDAIAHCTDDIKTLWIEELRNAGVQVDD